MSDQIDCPKCGGTGKVTPKSWSAGKAQHIFDIGWGNAKPGGIGPWGRAIYICRRCKIERTYNGRRVVYKVGDNWTTGVGCIPRHP